MWIIYSFIAAVIIAINALIYKFLATKGEPTSATICVFKTVAAICCLIKISGSVDLSQVTSTQWGLLFLTGVLSNLGDIGQLTATSAAPNPGYVQAIIQIQGVIILILSCVFLNLCLTVTVSQVIGVLMCVLGAGVICLPERR